MSEKMQFLSVANQCRTDKRPDDNLYNSIDNTMTSRFTIFDYTDYRLFLRDYYFNEKKCRPAFTYKYFAKRAGISSIGFYKDVIDGRAQLGHKMMRKFIKALCLKDDEALYFELMIDFCNSESDEERNQLLKKMQSLRPADVSNLPIEKSSAYYSVWYNIVIHTLILTNKIKCNVSEISEMIIPHITVEQVKESIELLLRLEMVKVNESGYFEAIEPLVSSGKKCRQTTPGAFDVVFHQKDMTKIGIEAFHRFPFNQLDMSSLTIAISETTFLEIKKELSKMRNKFLAMALRDWNADRVYQLNIQCFPFLNEGIKE
jgi:uncharacterized protein (TIGR02147 family)